MSSLTPADLDRIERTPRDYDGDVPDKLIERMARTTGEHTLRLIGDDVRAWLTDTDDAQPGDRERLLAAYAQHYKRLTGRAPRTGAAKEAAR